MIDHQIYQRRREQILDAIGNNVAVIFAAPERCRSNDTFYPYRQDSDFYYLTGFNEPESVLILNGVDKQSILFCRDKHPERETWDGFRYGPNVAQDVFGFSQAFSIDVWQEYLEAASQNIDYLYSLWNRYPEQDKKLMSVWTELQGLQVYHHLDAPIAMADLTHIIHPMRMIKSADEIVLLEKAAHISAMGHIRAMQTAQAGQHEYQVEAELLHTFMQYGARDVAYNSIVATGKNACTLHYVSNQDILQHNDLLLIDAGAEYQGYAGDITRTFPVSGRFSCAQKDLYEVVLAANTAVIAESRPGVTWQSMGELAIDILTQGLIDLNILSGSLIENVEKQTYRRFYMHGIGHWIGLDVHDVGGRFVDAKPIVLQENMCTTVEPGLYIPAAPDIPEHFHNLGIRIEDNIVITENGCRAYTHEVPKEINEIEALMCG